MNVDVVVVGKKALCKGKFDTLGNIVDCRTLKTSLCGTPFLTVKGEVVIFCILTIKLCNMERRLSRRSIPKKDPR